jgi:hypothetical protein
MPPIPILRLKKGSVILTELSSMDGKLVAKVPSMRIKVALT